MYILHIWVTLTPVSDLFDFQGGGLEVKSVVRGDECEFGWFSVYKLVQLLHCTQLHATTRQ